MMEYDFMPAPNVAELDVRLESVKDYIFGDLNGEVLTEERLETLSVLFSKIDKLIGECKTKGGIK